MSNPINSYTAANSFPLKIFKNEKLIQSIASGKVIPWHLQLNPTNLCNYNCKFCSCANRDKQENIPFDEISEMLILYKSLGLSCVTITGGGEPTLYKDISKLLKL